MIMSVSFVSANEDVSQVTTQNNELSTGESNNIYVNTSVESAGSGSESSPYKTISQAIDESSEGDTIYIASGTYSGEGNVGLTIDKTLSLKNYGNGEVILDGEQNTQILYVTSGNVLIDGLTFINANADIGSAIYFESTSTTNIINNSRFINNTAKWGGAVYFDDDYNTLISNTVFENNSALEIDGNGGYGGAFYAYNCLENTVFCNVSFINNTATYEGGAVYAYYGSKNVSYTNSKFKNNSVINWNGGAICTYSSEDDKFINSTFISNYAGWGGAILFNSNTYNLLMDNTTFTNNTGFSEGGAIYIWYGYNITVKNSKFKNNTSPYGGAIYSSYVDEYDLTNDEFMDNQASSTGLTPKVDKFNNTLSVVFEGGNNILNAIYSQSSISRIIASNVTYWGVDGSLNSDESAPVYSNFEQGQNITCVIYDSMTEEVLYNITNTTDEEGSVVFNYSEISKNNSFKYVIYHLDDSYYTSISISDEFNPNIGDFEMLQYLLDEASENSVINLERNYTYSIGLDTIAEGIAVNKNNLTINLNGFCIDALAKSRIFYVQSPTFNILNGTLKNGYSTSNGGAVYFTQAVNNCSFMDVDFINNTASSYGGAVYMQKGSSNSQFIRCNFKNNTASRGGAAINIDSTSINDKIINTTFKNNTARANGAGVRVSSATTNLTVLNSSFKDNLGISLNFNALSNSQINNTNFEDNSATAIYIASTSYFNTFYDSLFKNNGVGIYIKSTSSQNIFKNLTFVNNTAKSGSGIYLTDSNNDIINNSQFVNNTASSYGGAIYVEENIKNMVVENTTFESNTASRGGAIYFDEDCESENVKFITSLFKNNNAGMGGAVCYYHVELSDTLFKNTGFISNIGGNGGAIVFNGASSENTTFINCTFDENTANRTGSTNYGGAILYYTGSSSSIDKIINCSFTNNIAGYGGAVSFYGCDYSNLNLSGIIFINNTAKYNGGAVHTQNSDIGTVEKSVFANNSAVSGAAIYLYGSSSRGIIKDSILINNNGNYIIQSSGNVIANYNWFGSNSTDYTTKPNVQSSVTLTNWLFINATVNPSIISMDDVANLLFILKLFNSSSDEINDYDNSKLPAIVLLLNYNDTTFLLNSSVDFIPQNTGNVTITAGYITVCESINLTVCKGNSTVSIDDIVITYGNDINLTAVCRNAESISAVLFDENNTEVESDISIEGFNIIISNLDSGNYTLNVTTVVGKNYNSAVNSSKIQVNRANSTIIINPIEITVGETAFISVSNLSDGELIAVINNTQYSGTVNKGINISGLTAGSYSVEVIFKGNKNYLNSTNYTTITVNKIKDYQINTTLTNIASKSAVVTVNLPENTTGAIMLEIGGDVYYNNITNGEAIFKLENLNVNTTYNGLITYFGDDNYESKKLNISFTTNEKLNPNLNALFENSTIHVSLNENATGNLAVVINETSYSLNISNGSASLYLSNLDDGNYDALIIYSGDVNYSSSNVTLNFTVKTYYIVDASDLVKYYSGTERFTVMIYDSNQNKIANESVVITINGVSYNKTTNSNGSASISVNLNSGSYIAVVEFKDIVIKANVTVKPTVNGSDVIKVFRNQTQYDAKFSDSNGDVLANTTVSFNINGVYYNRTTNADGVAHLNINLAQGNYTLTATNPSTGEMCTNNITVLSKIIENSDLVKYYRNASQYVVKLVDDNGNPVSKGEVVSFNINGIIYNRTTNADGYARLNINLGPGEYVITAEYKNCRISNRIVVKTVLIADNLEMSYRDGSRFSVKLLDGNGNPSADKNITLNINGMIYTRSTNASGVAKLNINLINGEYIITSSYEGMNIVNTIIIH